MPMRPPNRPHLPRRLPRRATAALAAGGLLALAGAAPADPPPLAAPAPDGYEAEPEAAPALAAPTLAAPAPSPLSGAFDRAARPVAPRVDRWRPLAGPRDEAEPAEADEPRADEKPERRSRGWLTFAPLRVRPVSNLSDPPGGGGYAGEPGLAPEPDPISSPRTAYRPQGLYGGPGSYDGGPAPAPLPMDDPYAAPGADGFAPVPRSSAPPERYAPPENHGPPGGYGEPLPPGVTVRRGMPVRDLRTPLIAPPAYGVPAGGYAAPYPAPTGVPFGDPYGAPHGAAYGGIGAGLGAGPIADLAVAGGMCDLGLCDGSVPLFRRVRIEDPHNVHPRAVHQVIAVADPRFKAPPHGLAKLFHRECTGCARGCRECAPGLAPPPSLVFVEVCVPPCRPEEVKVTRHGHRVHLDYGKYEVTLTSRDGCVKVDYDD